MKKINYCGESKQTFTIKKFKVGVASVLLGSLFFGVANHAHAESVMEEVSVTDFSEVDVVESEVTAVETDVESTVDVAPENETVFEKERLGTVEIHDLDNEGNDLSPITYLEQPVGSDYFIGGLSRKYYHIRYREGNYYIYDRTEGETSGQITEEPIIINYIYKPMTHGVLIRYVDERDNSLYPSEWSGDKSIGSEYDYTPNEWRWKYRLIRVEGDTKGVITNELKVLTYVYRLEEKQVPNNTPTVEEKPEARFGIVEDYDVDEEGNLLRPIRTTTGLVGTEYHVGYGAKIRMRLYQDGNLYMYIGSEGGVFGKITEDKISVKHIFHKLKTGLLIRVIDEQGNDLYPIEPQYQDAPVGTPYEDKWDYGPIYKGDETYEYVRTDGATKGVITDGVITLNYIYRVVPRESLVPSDYPTVEPKPEAQVGTVEVHVVDEEGNELVPIRYVYGPIGSRYSAQYGAKVLPIIYRDGVFYDYARSEGTVFGEITKDKIVVKHILKRVSRGVVVRVIDEQGNELYPTEVMHEDSPVGTPYQETWGNSNIEYITETGEYRIYEYLRTEGEVKGVTIDDVIVIDHVYRLVKPEYRVPRTAPMADELPSVHFEVSDYNLVQPSLPTAPTDIADYPKEGPVETKVPSNAPIVAGLEEVHFANPNYDLVQPSLSTAPPDIADYPKDGPVETKVPSNAPTVEGPGEVHFANPDYDLVHSDLPTAPGDVEDYPKDGPVERKVPDYNLVQPSLPTAPIDPADYPKEGGVETFIPKHNVVVPGLPVAPTPLPAPTPAPAPAPGAATPGATTPGATAASSEAALPETGESEATLIFGAAAMAILAGLGLVAPRKNEA